MLKGGRLMLKKVLFLALLLWSEAFCFECRIYNVGQANFVIIRHSDYCLIIDCGKKRNMNQSDDKKFFASVIGFIGDSHKSLVITHQHDDHYNFVNSISTSEGFRGFDYILIGNLRSEKTAGELSSLPNVLFCEVAKGGLIKNVRDVERLSIDEEVGQLSANTLQGCLGGDVGIQLLLPDERAGNHEHDQNLVLKVTYQGKSILFPGDASGKLLEKIYQDGKDVLLDRVNCILLSHHGSNDSGELEWFRQVIQRNCRQTLTIVSSDPTGRHALPWNMVKNLGLMGGYVSSHQISVRGQSGGNPLQVQTTQPLFTTCDTDLYYAITIDNGNGAVIMTDKDGNVF
ncbi:MAG: hypothetical protein LBJ13_01315 [Puniceicoccales bacterium]|jgi:hypothetical protein|nr:hypothetical protein [Puniceicoccales bacterium]